MADEVKRSKRMMKMLVYLKDFEICNYYRPKNEILYKRFPNSKNESKLNRLGNKLIVF